MTNQQRERLWELFHHTPVYNKKKWTELENLILVYKPDTNPVLPAYRENTEVKK